MQFPVVRNGGDRYPLKKSPFYQGLANVSIVYPLDSGMYKKDIDMPLL
jgi:hypothetical protein